MNSLYSMQSYSRVSRVFQSQVRSTGFLVLFLNENTMSAFCVSAGNALMIFEYFQKICFLQIFAQAKHKDHGLSLSMRCLSNIVINTSVYIMLLCDEKSYHGTFEWVANSFSVFVLLLCVCPSVRPPSYDMIIHKLFIGNSF